MSRLPLMLFALTRLIDVDDRALRMAMAPPQPTAPHVPPARLLNRKQRRAAKKQGRRR